MSKNSYKSKHDELRFIIPRFGSMKKGQSNVKYEKLKEEGEGKDRWKEFVERNADKSSSKWKFSTNTWTFPEKKGYNRF